MRAGLCLGRGLQRGGAGGLAYTRRSIQRLEEPSGAPSASEAKARAANQAKSEFLTAMSHELRTHR